MKKVLIFIIKLYQATPLTSHSMCRFTPTCSEYMIGCIEEFGCIHGIYLGIKRILRCRPGKHYGYDPVPKKEKK